MLVRFMVFELGILLQMVSMGGADAAVAMVAGVVAQGTPFDGKAGLLAGAAACQSNQFALGSIGMQGSGFKFMIYFGEYFQTNYWFLIKPETSTMFR